MWRSAARNAARGSYQTAYSGDIIALERNITWHHGAAIAAYNMYQQRGVAHVVVLISSRYRGAKQHGA